MDDKISENKQKIISKMLGIQKKRWQNMLVSSMETKIVVNVLTGSIWYINIYEVGFIFAIPQIELTTNCGT